MKSDELKRLLKKHGCYKEEDKKRHEWWHSPKTGISFPVTRDSKHDVPKGTLDNILKTAGIK